MSKFVEAIILGTNGDCYIHPAEFASCVRADTIRLKTRDFPSGDLNSDDFWFLIFFDVENW
jgi:hypothetical protein